MSQVLIVTGMHRSGTSLVASLFEHAGVNLGAQLLAPRKDNPLGFFEDVEFVEFHENALHTRGQDILVTRDFEFTPNAREGEKASRLIAARAERELWGWKDPRTCLFLDFWQERLPDAQVLFVYRHPFDVVLSLARRGEVVGFDFFNALDAWYVYNASCLDFARRHPESTLACSSYAIVEQIEAFNAALAQQFSLSLTLNTETRDSIFRAEQLRRTPRTTVSDALLSRIHPDALGLYQTLQERAVLKEDATLTNTPPEIAALSEYALHLATPWSEANRRAVLISLVALTNPTLYEQFAQTHVQKTRALETQRRAWEATAQERASVIREQSAWAEPRMKDLEALEANVFVRALRRLGLVPRN